MTERKRQWESYLKAVAQEAGFGPLREIRNEDGNLHSETEPAFRSPSRIIWYRNGRKHGVDADIFGSFYFYFNGVMIPPKFHKNPESLTIEEIFSHPNTEVRRVGLEIYGIERLDNENHFKVLDERSDGYKLLKIKIPGCRIDSTFVKVYNATPEIDGTYKCYFLSVPPDMKTVKEAIAWTFRMDEEEYSPQIET
jgi:hypothetical protein